MTEKIKIQEVLVVEGKDDTRRLREFFEVDTIETVGSAISEQTLAQIKIMQELRGVIVLTDPDFSGEQIRKKIMQVVPDCKHAFITKDQGKSRHANESLGVEHASQASLLHALKKVMTPQNQAVSQISQEVLLELGLLGGSRAKFLRQQIGERLNIGYTNGKQLAKRLAMFAIDEATLRQTIKKVEEECEK
ncbi:ribonuclease M5 [uncultured Enterococcus sp.]|uniref:ribonuclease M5 n=1 Tax=uncultured Enterococcus sp. TaxID=167972 RepID=UPI00262EDD31|nr:ribonuclease M5 [uncultured Enterococcus sp.]